MSQHDSGDQNARPDQARAERAEWSALMRRYMAHMRRLEPHGAMVCFCGSLDQLRATVARLDARAAADRPRSGAAAQRAAQFADYQRRERSADEASAAAGRTR